MYTYYVAILRIAIHNILGINIKYAFFTGAPVYGLGTYCAPGPLASPLILEQLLIFKQP